MKNLILKKFLIYPIFLTCLIPNLNLKAFEREVFEDIRNWKRDDYWIKKLSEIDRTICKVLSENREEFSYENCLLRDDPTLNKYNADQLRKNQCDEFINNDFNFIKREKIKNQIIADCKLIYNSYKDDNDFDPKGFSSFYVSFALDKKLPFYEGEFVNGKRHGYGVQYYSDGAIYKGEYKNDEMHGQGTFSWLDGHKYIGDFKFGNKDGKGSDFFVSGDKYVGEYVKNKFEGKGTYFFRDGSKYIGDFKNDLYEGEGTYFWKSSGATYNGQYKNNKRNGLGTYKWNNDDKYIGYWLNDNQAGKGILFNKKGGIKKQGIWEDGSLKTSQKVNLSELKKIKISGDFFEDNNHESCLKASDYRGCMNYKKGIDDLNNNNEIIDVNCINNICSPEEAKIYSFDNLGLKVLPGYYFIDIPEKRSANYISKPLKLNVNGSYGRYLHIQRIIRYYSEGYSGSLTTIPGIRSDSTPTINFNPGKIPGIRQIVMNHIFDCEDKTTAKFDNNRLKKSQTSSERKKKWLNFDETKYDFINRLGISSCKKSKNYIMSLNFSPFDKFQKKEIKSSSKK